MTLKNILILIVFSLLSIYTAFLNSHEVEVYLTQSFSLRLPMVIFLFGFILSGVVIAIFLNWILSVKSSWGGMKASFKKKKHDKKGQWHASQLEKGDNALAGENLEKAKALFTKILEAFPNHVGALDRMGKIELMEGNTGRALQLHLKANQIDPGNLGVLCGLADDYCNNGSPEKEIQTLEQIHKSEPKSPLILSRIRNSHVNGENWKNAADIQKRIIPLIRDQKEREKERRLFSRIIYRNGLLYWEKGQVDSAVSEFKKALKADKKCLPAYITMGDAFLKSGNKKNAVKIWKSGLTHTRSPLCLLRIQTALHEPDDLEGLIKIYREAIQSSNNSVKNSLILMLGILYMDKGKTDEALGILETIQPEALALHSVLLTNAYRQKQNLPRMREASQSAFDIAKESLFEVVCNGCKTPFKEWTSHCPQCKAWNSLSSNLQLGPPGK